MAPSGGMNYFTFAGMQELLRCSESDARRLELAVLNHIRDAGPQFPRHSCLFNWRTIEESDPVIKALLKGYLETGEKTEGPFREDIESMKSHLYSRAVLEVEKEKAEGKGITAEKTQAKRRWYEERDQDDDEPAPEKKLKLEAEDRTQAQHGPATLHSGISGPPSSLAELLKSQAVKFACDTIKAAEAHIKAAVAEQLHPQEERLSHWPQWRMALDDKESRLKLREAEVLRAEWDLKAKKDADFDTMTRWERDLMKREESLAELQKKRADARPKDGPSRNTHVVARGEAMLKMLREMEGNGERMKGYDLVTHLLTATESFEHAMQ